MGVIPDSRGMTRARNEENILENYNEIIRLICRIEVSEEKLELIKKDFVHEIDSPRRFEQIKTLEDLFQVLERRAVISCTNITKVFDIVRKLGNVHRIGALLNLHAKLLSKWIYPPVPYIFGMTLLPDYSPTLPDPVIDVISVSLKNSWKQFARALCIIRENKIDTIDDSDVDNEEKMRQVIDAFLQEARSHRLLNPYSVLFSSLEKIKRRDVKENIENMLEEIRYQQLVNRI